MSNSAVYRGTVRHVRLTPQRRSFDYPVYMLLLDLDELERGDALFEGSRWFGRTNRSPARFCRADFFGPADVPLSEAVRDEVERQTGERPTGPIRLLATPRSFGYQFNPIAVYHCFDPEGERLTHLLADVSNMPWRESEPYVFSADASGRVDGTAEKRMHVSPFMGMDQTYRLASSAPGQDIELLVTSSERGRVVFSAALRLERVGAGAADLRGTLLRFPAIALLVTARIFWQAAKLRLSGHRWHSHAAKRERVVQNEAQEAHAEYTHS